jgi:hypothetical protein
MRFKKTLIAGGVGFLALTGIALSQIIVVPLLTTLRQTDIIQVIPSGQPTAQSQYALVPLVTNVYGYYKSIPTTGFSYQIGANVTRVAFNPAGTLATGYVSVPANPSDGSLACVFTTQTITNFYVCAGAASVGTCSTTGINNAIAGTLSANTGACYLYSAGNASWDRD